MSKATELEKLRAEVARLRLVTEIWSGRYQVGGAWSDDGPEPAATVLLDEDGELVDLPGLVLDAAPLVRQVLRRQAQQWIRAAEDGEGPPLEALLALVPDHYELTTTVRCEQRYVACWGIGGSRDDWHSDSGPTRTAAIRAVTLRLLGVEQRPDGPGLPGVTVTGNLVSATPEEGSE